jgi:DNA-binding MarR family transcriptional regulator
VTVVLDRLEKAGFVRRASNPDDRRSILVGLVPAKHRRVMANYDEVQSQFESVTEDFTDQELETVLRFLSAANNTRPQMSGKPVSSEAVS